MSKYCRFLLTLGNWNPEKQQIVLSFWGHSKRCPIATFILRKNKSLRLQKLHRTKN